MLRRFIREGLIWNPVLFDRVKRINRTVSGESREIRFVKSIIDLSSGKSIIHIGANDGIRNDPIRELIVRYGTNTTLVEPDPQAFAELTKAYRQYRKSIDITLMNCAVAPEQGSSLRYCTLSDTARAELPRRTQVRLARKASSDRQRFEAALADEGYTNLPGLIAEIPVESIDINQLLDQRGTPDLLVIDAEGLDWQLVSALDMERFLPKAIWFETGQPSEKEREMVTSKLSRYGYEIQTFDYDVIAHRDGRL